VTLVRDLSLSQTDEKRALQSAVEDSLRPYSAATCIKKKSIREGVGMCRRTTHGKGVRGKRGEDTLL